MHPQHQDTHDNPQIEIATQQMVKAHTELTQLMNQNLINRDSKSLPPGMQQLLD
jgi:hypothetical protein